MPTNRKSRRHAILSLLLVAVSLLGLTAVTTGALFSDTQSVSGNQFVTGTVSLNQDVTNVPVTMLNMAPGDQATGVIHVTNTGTLAERYSMTTKNSTAGDDVLAAQLVLTIKTGVTTCTKAGFATDGTVVSTGILGTFAGFNNFGDPEVGNQTGDRTLAAGANEDLCMQVSLPKGTDNTFQGKTANATMTFSAEQVINNP